MIPDKMNKCYFCGYNKHESLVLEKFPRDAFLKCSKCGLISLSKGKDLKNKKDYYSSIYYPESFSGRENLTEAFSYRLPLISRFIKEGSSLLEIGSASGDFLNILKNFGHSVSGVELSDRAVLKARQNYNLDLFCGTLNEAEFESDKFDAVLAYHVIEHVDDPRALLREVVRITKPNGIVILEAPNPRSVDSFFSEKTLESILDYPNHTYAFPPKVLKSMVEEAGLDIIYIEKSFSYLVASFIKKFLSKKGPVGKEGRGVPKSESVEKGERRKTLGDYRGGGILKKIASILLPGMKYTIIAKRP